MAARYILPALSLVFLLVAAWRWTRSGQDAVPDPAVRTWLLVALIFAAVSAWLWHTS